MKLKNIEIIIIYQALNLLLKDNPKISVQLGYNIIKNIKILQPFYEITQDTIQNLYKNYGKEENGQMIILKENIEKVQKELKQLEKLEEEVKVEFIPYSLLQGIVCSFDIIEAIFPIIKKEEK